jgi:hypothetical protein
MARKKPDWFMVAVILGAGAAFIYLVIAAAPIAWLIP